LPLLFTAKQQTRAEERDAQERKPSDSGHLRF
jgi:hypothetical protein